MTEPWLRGPVEGVPPLLQPVAHALLMAREDAETACASLTAEQLWRRPGNIASVGFHLAHLSGSTERLLTYARGEQLSRPQLEALARERAIDDARPTGEELLAEWLAVADRTIATLSTIDEATLLEPRSVGRAELPSTLLGLLFHIAEHASRHTGQLVTTARLVSSGSLQADPEG